MASNAMNVLNMAAGAVMPRGFSFDPGSLAASLLNAARVGVGHGNSHQLAEVETALSAMAQNDPITAKAVRAAVMDALSPLEQGELLRLSCGHSAKRATVEMGPMEDAPPPQPPVDEVKAQINIGKILLSDSKTNPDSTRALPFFTEAQRLGTPQALKDAALSSIAVYNYEGTSQNSVRLNDVDGAGQMKPIAGAQDQLLGDVAKDMGMPDSDTAKAMRTGYAALASDAAMPAQIRQDAAQVVQLLDANTAAWDKYVLTDIKLNITNPAQLRYDARQRAITAFANEGLTRDLVGFTATGIGGAGVSIAAPIAGAALAAQGTPLFYAATGATGGTLNVGLGEVRRQMTGEETTPGKVVSDAIGGALVVTGVLPSLARYSSTVVGVGTGLGGGATGSFAEQFIDSSKIELKGILVNAAIGAVAGSVGGRFGSGDQSFNIKGVTSGRGGWASTYQSGMTRVNNGQNWTISPEVSIKGGLAKGIGNTNALVIENLVQGSVAQTPATSPSKKLGQ